MHFELSRIFAQAEFSVQIFLFLKPTANSGTQHKYPNILLICS